MFTKKSNIDVKKSIAKIQDSKKDSPARLKHLKTILGNLQMISSNSSLIIYYNLIGI